LSMRDAGLLPKDIAIVDRSKDAHIGSMVIMAEQFFISLH